MTKRHSIVALSLLLALGAAWICAAEAPARKPNIVLILVDDMGFSDIGCYGSEIPTPNIDRLAAEGVRFTQFYNTARCCPTRACLLTGLYPHQAGVGYMTDKSAYSSSRWINEWYAGDLRPDTVTIAELMRSAGYATYMAGKWHVTNDVAGKSKHNWPTHRGFDRYYGIIGGAANYYAPESLARDDTPIKADADPEYHPANYYFTDALGDQSVRFLSEHHEKAAEKPLFLYLAFTAAHWPMHAPPEDIAKYKGKYDGGYEPTRAARFAKQKQMGLIKPEWPLSPQFGDWSKESRKDWEARCMEVYAAMIDRMDQNVGKVVSELKREGQLDDTLILFLSDNGACAETVGRKKDAPMPGGADTYIAYGEAWANVSNTPFRLYKHFVHEGGISTPLIAYWPASIRRKGEFENQPGHLIDVMATCAEVAGATYPPQSHGKPTQPLEGTSLVKAFRGEPLARTRPIFWEHEGNRAIRAGDWKLVSKNPERAWELYDVAKDRMEMNDLAAQQPDRVKAMAAEWDAFAKRTHALPWPWGKPYGDEVKVPVAK